MLKLISQELSPWLATALSLTLLWTSAPTLTAQDNLADIIERCEKSLVRIEVKSDEGDSLGSGFIIDSGGTIATNVHVLAGATSAKAIFPNQQVFTIVGTTHIDPKRDIAIAKLDGVAVEQLPVLPFASHAARKGDRVVALGSPLGLSFSATSGVVSAIRTAAELGRELGDKDLAGTWFQVDAALSPGNSGGPIINYEGEIVAMSTLASQGAQNLNFGISGDDIKTAKELSAGKPLKSLADGVGKIRSQESRGRRDEGIIEYREIPKSAIEAYVAAGRSAFKSIQRDLNQEIERLRADLRQMKTGETFIPQGISDHDVDVARVNNPARRGARVWYFRSEAVKRREIAATETRQRELSKVKMQATNPDDKAGLLTLLWKYGPRIDTRVKGSIGYLTEAIVLHAFNEHDAIIVYNDAPYLLYLDSTAGLFMGQEVTAAPVFVSGTATAEIKQGMTASMTVLQCLSYDELKEAIYGDAEAPDASSTAGQPGKPVQTPDSSNGTGNPALAGSPQAGAPGQRMQNNPSSSAVASSNTPRNGLYAPPSPSGARLWYDRSGKHSVEAILLQVSETEVVLRRLDGKIIRVRRDSLSDADQIYLKK